MRTIVARTLVIFALVYAACAAPKQCTQGACCDISTGMFKAKDSECSPSTHECRTAITQCDGFNAHCNWKAASDDTPCTKGTCKSGECIVKEEKKVEKKEEAKKEEMPTTLRTSTKQMTPKEAVATLIGHASNAEDEISLLEKLKKEEKEDTEKAADYFINKMVRSDVDKAIENNSPSKRITRKMTDETHEQKKLNELLLKDTRNRMKYFQGLTRELMKANRMKFNKPLEMKKDLAEKYAEDIKKEHEIIRKQVKALDDVGYYSKKYYNTPLVTSGTTTSNNTLLSSSNKSVLASVFQGETGGINIAAVIIGSIAIIAVVVIVVVVTEMKKNHATTVQPQKEEFEKF